MNDRYTTVTVTLQTLHENAPTVAVRANRLSISAQGLKGNQQ